MSNANINKIADITRLPTKAMNNRLSHGKRENYLLVFTS